MARHEEAIRGTVSPQHGSRPRRIDGERQCAEGGCDTKLSTYNRTSYCWIHEAPHPFVLDGVRPRKDRPVPPDPMGPRRVA